MDGRGAEAKDKALENAGPAAGGRHRCRERRDRAQGLAWSGNEG